MSTTSSFKDRENEHDIYRSKNCMKKFCESLKEQPMKITDFKQTNKQQVSFENAKICYIFLKRLKIKMQSIKYILKLEIIVIIQVNIEVMHIAYAT